MSKQVATNCPVCKEPITGPENAVVTHLECAMDDAKEAREKQQKNREFNV